MRLMRVLRLAAPSACVAALVLVSWPHGVAPIAAAARRVTTPICRIYLDPHDKFTSVGAPVTRSRFGLTTSMSLSTITVNYDAGFNANPQAKTAFQAAVDIWQQQVQSSVPIVIDASFTNFGRSDLLGQAGSSLVDGFANQPRVSTFYPFPLANSLSGQDLGGHFPDPAASHIDAQFNSAASWYFGTDGATPGGSVDFESVVLHELGHGLGFFGSGSVSGGVGTIGSQGLPFIYDAFVQDNAGTSILNYPNSSTQLASALQSNALFWFGSNGVAAAGAGGRPKLYAPATFDPGSSYSHLDDATYPAGTINSLMTHAIGMAESIHTPGPIMLGMFRDMGWTTAAGAGACIYTLSPSTLTVPAAGAASSIQLTAPAGCAWTATSGASFITITGAASGSGTANITVNVQANASASFRSGTVTIGGQTLTVNQNGTGPAFAIDRTSLVFGATNNFVTLPSKTSAQTVRLTQGAGTGTVTWTAASNRPWLTVTPANGTGSGVLTIDVQFVQGLASTQTGTVTVGLTGAGNANTFTITVTLNVVNGTVSAAPFGSFDSPLNGTAGVTGSIAVTGWALDDVEVSRVRIFRDAVAGEPAGFVFVGDATLVDGARSDVVATYPAFPRNTRAGWGYLLLTNFLPNAGNGAFRFTAFVDDVEGHTTMLTGPTISCSNASSIAPFGAIDTPAQGAMVSGTINNFGWTLIRNLAPAARADVPGGATVNVVIDGAVRGTPSGWTSRSDIASLFPTGYANTASSVAVLPIDTTTLSNGVHTIAWGVVATNGQAAGVGSRFFTVSNSGVVLDAAPAGTSPVVSTPRILELPRAAALRIGGAASLEDEVAAAAVDMRPVTGRRGFVLDAPYRTYRMLGGVTTVQSEELDRIELQLGCTAASSCAGYLRTPGGISPLPIGSHLVAASGVFTWQPGVGFLGGYDFTFVRWRGGRAASRQDVRIVLNPKGTGRVGPQIVIDTPTSSVASGFSRKQPILLAGWAADLDSDIDSGVDTVHVWAYPVVDSGTRHGDPIWIGVAAYGGSRPDVAAVYGERFKKSSYGIYVNGLPPGTYDLAVFAYSTVTGGFAPASTVRVTIQ